MGRLSPPSSWGHPTMKQPLPPIIPPIWRSPRPATLSRTKVARAKRKRMEVELRNSSATCRASQPHLQGDNREDGVGVRPWGCRSWGTAGEEDADPGCSS